MLEYPKMLKQATVHSLTIKQLARLMIQKSETKLGEQFEITNYILNSRLGHNVPCHGKTF